MASLSFALAQAKARRMKRIVYVIPYTSIIEQTAQAFREILGDENVLEFHSGVQFDQQEDDASSPEAVPLDPVCGDVGCSCNRHHSSPIL